MTALLLKSSLLVAGCTLCSRVFGLGRDMVMAHLLGASALNDAFVLANRIPNFFRRLFAEGAFSQAFVPTLAQIQSLHGHDAVRLFLAKVAGTLGVLITLVTLAGMLGAPLLMLLFAPGWYLEALQQDGENTQYAQATLLLQLVFPYLCFVTMAAVAGAVLNIYNRFAISAFSPVFFNITVIVTALWLSPYVANPAIAIASGVSLGGLCQLLWLTVFLRKERLWVKPCWAWQDPQIKRIWQAMLPALLGVSAAQVSMLINSIIASFLQTGALSWLTYADRLLEFPLGIFGLAIVTVILPELSRQVSQSEHQAFGQRLNWASQLICLTGLPSMAGLWLLAEPLVLTLFQSGSFTVQDAHACSKSLQLLCLGLLPLMLVKVFASAFYAHQNIQTPVRSSVISIGVSIVLNLLLTPWLGYLGLAITSTASAIINVLLLGYLLQRQLGCSLSRQTGLLISKSGIACLVMAAGLSWLNPDISLWQNASWQWRAVQLMMLLGIAVALYLSSLWLLGCRIRHFAVSANHN